MIFNSKMPVISFGMNNKYQVNQVTKENIDENLKTEGNLILTLLSLFAQLYWLHNGMPKKPVVLLFLRNQPAYFQRFDNVNLFWREQGP